MPRPSDRALRKLVADLAERPTADVKAVLAELGSTERERVEQLFAEFSGAGAALETAGPAVNTEGLSPWLAVRLRGASGGSLKEVAMTPRALAALQAAAGGAAARPMAPTAPPKSPGSALYDLFTRWLNRPAP